MAEFVAPPAGMSAYNTRYVWQYTVSEQGGSGFYVSAWLDSAVGGSGLSVRVSPFFTTQDEAVRALRRLAQPFDTTLLES